MKIHCLILTLLVCASCASTKPITTVNEFDRLSHYAGLGHFYYIGSQGETNHYATSYFLSGTRYYSFPQSEYPISTRFPRTQDRNQWRPYLRNLNDNLEGFSGEDTKTMDSIDTEQDVEHVPPGGRGEAPRP